MHSARCHDVPESSALAQKRLIFLRLLPTESSIMLLKFSVHVVTIAFVTPSLYMFIIPAVGTGAQVRCVSYSSLYLTAQPFVFSKWFYERLELYLLAFKALTNMSPLAFPISLLINFPFVSHYTSRLWLQEDLSSNLGSATFCVPRAHDLHFFSFVTGRIMIPTDLRLK